MRQVSQTRFYVTESRTITPHVSLFVGGLPPGLSPQEYSHLLHEAMATKGVTLGWPGLLVGVVHLPFLPFEPNSVPTPGTAPQLPVLSPQGSLLPSGGPWTSRGQALLWSGIPLGGGVGQPWHHAPLMQVCLQLPWCP